MNLRSERGHIYTQFYETNKKLKKRSERTGSGRSFSPPVLISFNKRGKVLFVRTYLSISRLSVEINMDNITRYTLHMTWRVVHNQ
jgi:hypothetical protein